MKKLFLFAASLTAILISCQELAPLPEPETIPESGIDTNSDTQSEPKEYVEQSFTATTGQDSKTSIQNNGYVFWNSGDKINVNGSQYSTSDGNSTSATFSGPAVEKMDGYYNAYYPSYLLANGVPTLPEVQEYDADKPGSNCPMFGRSQTSSITFSNICGVLKLNVNAPGKHLRYITVEASQKLSGPFSIVDGAAVVSDSGETMTVLNCIDADITSAKDFFIAIPPTTLENLVLGFYATDGSFCRKSVKSGKTYTIARSEIESITFSSPLVFQDAQIATYYSHEGALDDDDDHAFNYSGIWRLRFDDIDLGRGDYIETFFNFSEDTGYIFLVGRYDVWDSTDHKSDEGPLVFARNQNNQWLGLNYYAPGVSIGSPTSIHSVNTITDTLGHVFVKISSEGVSYKLKKSDEWHTGASDRTSEPLLSLMKMGTQQKPMWIGAGNAGGNGRAAFSYLKVVRSFSPSISVPVQRVDIIPDHLTMAADNAVTLQTLILPGNATSQTLSWTSSDPSVATVDNNGKVVGQKSGTVTITATSTDGSNTFGTCVLTVQDDDDDEEIIGDYIYFSKKGRRHNNPVEFAVQDDDEKFHITIPDISWANDDTLEVQITHNGLEGMKFIIGSETPTYANQSFIYFLANNAAYWSALNNSNNQSIYASGVNSQTVTVRIVKDKIEYMLGTGGNWTAAVINDNTLANILDLNPLHIGLFGNRAAERNNASTINYIKLRTKGAIPVESIELSENQVEMNVATMYKLDVTNVLPTMATNKNVVWASSNEDFATITQDGTITAKKIGGLSVTATAEDGSGVVATCAVIVRDLDMAGETITTDTTYYSKKGHPYNTPQQFLVFNEDKDSFKFPIYDIKWSSGDYLEFCITQNEVTGDKIVFGDPDATAWGQGTFAHVRSNGTWMNVLSSGYSKTLPGGHAAKTIAYRMTASGMYFRDEGASEWTFIPDSEEHPCYEGVTSQDPLWFGVYGNNSYIYGDHSCTVNYIKVVSGGVVNHSSTGGTNAGGTINTDITTW